LCSAYLVEDHFEDEEEEQGGDAARQHRGGKPGPH